MHSGRMRTAARLPYPIVSDGGSMGLRGVLTTPSPEADPLDVEFPWRLM